MVTRSARITLVAAIFIVSFCQFGAWAKTEPGFKSTYQDVKVLWEGYKDVEAFREEYYLEIWKAKFYIEAFKTGDFLTRTRIAMDIYELLRTERGKRMTREGIGLYKKYDSHALKVLRKYCPIGPDGRISDADVRRSSKKIAKSYMYYQWQEHPFSLTLQPWKLYDIYKTAYDKTYDSLKLYQSAVEFFYDENPLSKLMRSLLGLDSGFDLDDYDYHDLIDLLNYDDFDPNDALNKVTEPSLQGPSDRIRLDPSKDL